MIADQDVITIYRQVPEIHLGLTDAEIEFLPHQIFRGIPMQLWKDIHPSACYRYLSIFTNFRIIPKYCFDCYKILVSPRNVVELFKLLMVFEKIALPLDNTRKCSVEERKECSGTYKGLVYCRGLDEGNKILRIIRKVVSEDISPEVSVTLKRGCSEFEHAYPEFARIEPNYAIMQHRNDMQYRNEWQILEDSFDKNLASVHQEIPFVNADIAKFEAGVYTDNEILCMQFWLRYAATIGDMSYLAITGMTMPPISYIKRPPFRGEISA